MKGDIERLGICFDDTRVYFQSTQMEEVAMRFKYAFILVVAGCMFISAGLAMAFDVAISSHAGWWGQGAADGEMEELKAAIEGSVGSVEIFALGNQGALATWVRDNTADGESDILILCGQFPNTIYEPGNAQADASLAEIFLDSGNTILNTGDYMFYVVDGAGTNAAGGLQTMMDIPAITMWDDNTAVKVTNEGKNYTPSLQDFQTDRPFHLDQLEGGWEPLLIMAQNDAGTRADPVIVINRDTGGMVGIFYQTSGQDNDPRAAVISEFIISYFRATAVAPAGKLATSWCAIKR